MDGQKWKVLAYGKETITSPITPLDMDIIKSLFPVKKVSNLGRDPKDVGLLLGIDPMATPTGLQPEKLVAKAGEHLCIMCGKLGETLHGTHPRLREDTKLMFDTKSVCNIVQT